MDDVDAFDVATATIDEVMASVGDDEARVRWALEQELAREGDARSTLLSKLEALLPADVVVVEETGEVLGPLRRSAGRVPRAEVLVEQVGPERRGPA